MGLPSTSVILPVLLGHEWHYHLTEFVVKTMRCTAPPFELVIVETGSKKLEHLADVYIHRPERTTLVKDSNAGFDASHGDFRIQTGNDVIMKPGWLEALHEPFLKYKDCGISTLSVAEPGAFIGPRQPQALIVEAMYGPLMMFRKEWKLDPVYISMASDNDLVMRIYNAGLRSYRNCRVQVFHLGGVTWGSAYSAAESKQNQDEGLKTFYERWGDSPLMMLHMFRRGGVAFGREHE